MVDFNSIAWELPKATSWRCPQGHEYTEESWGSGILRLCPPNVKLDRPICLDCIAEFLQAHGVLMEEVDGSTN